MLKSSSMIYAGRIRGLVLWTAWLLGSPTTFAAIRVVNEGVPGESSAEVAAHLDAVLDRYKPQFVVIFVGMNDAVNDRKFLAPEQTGKNIATMVVRSRAKHAQVVLVTVHDPDVSRLLQRHKPEVYGNVTPVERIQMLNRAISEVARRYNTPLADFHNALEKAGGANARLSTDGVHLTATGYALLASTVRRALPKHIDPESTVLCVGDSLTYGIGVRPADASSEGNETYPAQLQSLLR